MELLYGVMGLAIALVINMAVRHFFPSPFERAMRDSSRGK